MIRRSCVYAIVVLLSTLAVRAQQTPIYQVTVIARTVQAVNYQYRRGSTRVDLRGTVLLPLSKGDAVVESKTGRVEVDARFEKVLPATRFGHEYLTYVLWAITPEGHARNLGEVVADGANRARLTVTTDLQAFALIVTAEPYAAVRQPSDVVVMENEIRKDTVGHIEPVQAKAELLPRGHYTYTVPPEITAAAEGRQKPLSMEQYEIILQVYEAQNAVQIAKAMGADRYAPDTFSRAEELLREAQNLQVRHADRGVTVTAARHAAQTAEDARAITLQRKHEEEIGGPRGDVGHERRLRIEAEAAAQRARAQSSADRMQLDVERNARHRAESDAAAARAQAANRRALAPIAEPIAEPLTAPARESKTELRVSLLRELRTALPARDTPMGLVVTLPNGDFRGVALNRQSESRLARVALVVSSHPGLRVTVEGASQGTRDEGEAAERAVAVRNELVRSGVPASAITARGIGAARPLAPAGKPENRRVEVIIEGEPIGRSASWDKAYSLVPR